MFSRPAPKPGKSPWERGCPSASLFESLIVIIAFKSYHCFISNDYFIGISRIFLEIALLASWRLDGISLGIKGLTNSRVAEILLHQNLDLSANMMKSKLFQKSSNLSFRCIKQSGV